MDQKGLLTTFDTCTQHTVPGPGIRVWRSFSALSLSPTLSSFLALSRSLSIARDVLPGPPSAAPLFVRVTPCLALMLLVRAARAAILARALAKH